MIAPSSDRIYLIAMFAVSVALGATALAEEAATAKKSVTPLAANLPVEQAILTSAPNVPPPITRKTNAKVVVELEVSEVTKRLADGVQYTFWTFGGSVPGKFIRVLEGDVVELHLNNHQNSKMPHNIDLHAVTGPGGGAASTFTAPGHSSQFTFTALHPGLYVYHCATTPVPMHIANGMYGMIFVQPKEGWAPVDREFYVMQGDIYTQGKTGEPGLQLYDNNKSIDENPSYVVFNGAVGSLVGDNALQANVGETVRIYFGVGGPNLTSSFHVIGEIFDRVYTEGGTKNFQEFVQTTMVPAGGSTIVEFKVEVPGTLVMVDHSLNRAFNKGALGMIKVSGPENPVIYSGKEVDEVYIGQSSEAGTAAGRRVAELTEKRDEAIAQNPEISGLSREIQSERGKKVFLNVCFACHLPTGQGLPGIFPPLAGSDFLNENPGRAIQIVLRGLSGPVTVNGTAFNNVMPPLGSTLDDNAIADVLTYVLGSWSNKGGTVSPDDVRRTRAENP